ncbi:hypothetical protein DVV91_17280 [Clostridium botulinum]|nr:hypothetical protein [Clostridium botulinum]
MRVDDELKRKEGESENEYKGRLYRDKISLGLSNKKINEIINKELETNLAESTTRCNATIWNDGFNCGFEKALSQRGVTDELKELEEKKLELEKMKIQYQDQKREYRNYLRADSRFEHLQQEMIYEIQKLNNYKPLYNTYVNTYCGGDNEASLILSDIHLGMEINDKFNKYNKQIAKERLDDLKNKVISYCRRHRVKVLHIELLGDLVNGYLHIGNRVNNEEDVISQTMLLSEMLSNFINIMAKEIPFIKIYSTIGNHGRCSANIKDSLSIENFERLIPWYMKTRIQCDNVKFIENKEDDEIIVYKAINETIFACHGHKDKIGSVVNDLTKMLKIFPTEVHMGHWHRHSTIEDNDIELIINGSFAGTDEYAESIRKSNKPSQTLIIYNIEGQECVYKIKL